MKETLLESTSTADHTIRTDYRAEIDGLRAFAVIAVIINHFSKSLLPAGYLGVDIFFVISGYVITASMTGRPTTTFKSFLQGFISRRIKRLVPALAFFVLIASLLSCLFDSEHVMSLRTGIASLFGLSNLYLLKQATDYFGTSSELNMFTHTWSLGVEEQFYILFPILAWFFGLSGSYNLSQRRFLSIITTLSFVSLFLFIHLYSINQPAAYYLMPTRFWELGTGCLLFLCMNQSKLLNNALKKTPSSLMLIFIIFILFLPYPFALFSTISVVFFTALLIGSLRAGSFAYHVLTHEKAVYIGKISYSLYLWHWGVLSISRHTIGIHAWTVPIQVIVMFVLAIASFNYVELPLRHAQWSNKGWKTISLGISSLTGSAICVAFLLLSGNHLYLGVKKEISHNNSISFESQNLHRTDGTLLLVGDSHAEHLSNMAEMVATELGMNFKIITQGATTFPIVNISSPVGGLTFERNKNRGELISGQLADYLVDSRHSEADLIILSSFYRFYFEAPSGSRKHQSVTHYDDIGQIITTQEAFEAWLTKLEVFAKDNPTKNIVMVLSTPEMPGIYPESVCSKEWFRPIPSRNCRISMPRDQVIRELDSINKIISERSSTLSNVFVFDPTPSVCPHDHEHCYSHIDGVRLFSDEDHLTIYGSSKIKKDFTEFLLTNKLRSSKSVSL